MEATTFGFSSKIPPGGTSAEEPASAGERVSKAFELVLHTASSGGGAGRPRISTNLLWGTHGGMAGRVIEEGVGVRKKGGGREEEKESGLPSGLQCAPGGGENIFFGGGGSELNSFTRRSKLSRPHPRGQHYSIIEVMLVNGGAKFEKKRGFSIPEKESASFNSPTFHPGISGGSFLRTSRACASDIFSSLWYQQRERQRGEEVEK